ncbi:hypothetical protein MCO_00215 [Bartonella sp. DB5-6]|nr:hypothetical protein MCO_00215 [Bartonella sp. DB5-6]
MTLFIENINMFSSSMAFKMVSLIVFNWDHLTVQTSF